MMNETLQSRSRSTLYAIAAACVGLGCVIFVFRKETKEAVVQELSDVASRSLGEQNMQAQAAMVTIQTLQALLEHGETVQRSVTFLSAVAEHEQTREALIKLLVSALTPNRHTPLRTVGKSGWHINTATDPPPLAQPRKGRNAVDLREACSGRR